jgi:iron complex outermembrane receptor protein
VLFSLHSGVRVFASAYKAFRAPSLQELYRSFQVGNIVTLPNENLRAERLTGSEVGLSTSKFRGKVSVRGTLFWSQVEQPIANVTLSVTPQLITRQRQNLGLTRSRGVEVESEITLSKSVALSAGYQFVDATVVSFPTNRSREGLQIAQVSPHQFTFQTRYLRGPWTLAAQGRASSSQFDDDLNQLPLGSYFTADLLLSRRVTSKLTLFASCENLFNQRYMVARTPVPSLGPPLLWQIGARVNLARR